MKKTTLSLALIVTMAIGTVACKYNAPDITKAQNITTPSVKTAEPTQASKAPEPSSELDANIIFIDVGQGDSTLITSKGMSVLIDTGKYEAYDNVQDILAENNVTDIDILILTHPDADHIQNASEIITDYNVSQVIMPKAENDTKAYDNLMSATEKENVPIYNPLPGDTFLAGDMSFKVLAPSQNYYEDTNSYSIVIKATCGRKSFLFMGDATGEELEDVADTDFSADVYKVAHHGSANCGCNSIPFLNAVSPEYMIISCEYQNDYGHPHREVMEYAETMCLPVFRTDLQGSIACHCGGSKFIWNTAPTTNYICGSDE